MCAEAQDTPDNLSGGDNKMKCSTSGVYCVLKLFGKVKSYDSPQ